MNAGQEIDYWSDVLGVAANNIRKASDHLAATHDHYWREIARALRQGVSQQQLATLLGVSRQRVAQLAAKGGWKQ